MAPSRRSASEGLALGRAVGATGDSDVGGGRRGDVIHALTPFVLTPTLCDQYCYLHFPR